MQAALSEKQCSTSCYLLDRIQVLAPEPPLQLLVAATVVQEAQDCHPD